MHIKQQTVIPPGVKITRVPAAHANARSVWALGREKEQELMAQAEAGERLEKFNAARAQGMSVAEAALLAYR